MRRRGILGAVTVIAGLALAACTTPESSRPPPSASLVATPPSALRPYPKVAGGMSCVPFARAVSGIDIHGDAWTWWQNAAGHYARGSQPQVGAVLTLKRTRSLRLGHVAVVAAVQGPREIMVTHANWDSDGNSRGAIHERQPVVDVSAANDWSEVRFMNTLGSFGRPYAAWGFIYQQPVDTDSRTAARHRSPDSRQAANAREQAADAR